MVISMTHSAHLRERFPRISPHLEALAFCVIDIYQHNGDMASSSSGIASEKDLKIQVIPSLIYPTIVMDLLRCPS